MNVYILFAVAVVPPSPILVSKYDTIVRSVGLAAFGVLTSHPNPSSTVGGVARTNFTSEPVSFA